MSYRTEDDTLASLGGFHRYRNRNYGEQYVDTNIKPTSTGSYEQSHGRKKYSETRQESGGLDSRYASSNKYNIQVDDALYESNRNLVMTRAPTICYNDMDMDENGGTRETHDEPSGKSELSIDSQEMYALRMMQTKQTSDKDKRQIQKSNATSKPKWPWMKSKTRNKDDSSFPKDQAESKMNDTIQSRNNDVAWVRSYSGRAGSVYFGKSISDIQNEENYTYHNSARSLETDYLSNDGEGGFVKKMTAKLNAQRRKFMSDMDHLLNESGSLERSYYIMSDSDSGSDYTRNTDQSSSDYTRNTDQSSAYAIIELGDNHRNVYDRSLSEYSDVSNSFDDDYEEEFLGVTEKKKATKITNGLVNRKKSKTRSLENETYNINANKNSIGKATTKTERRRKKERKKARFQSIGIDKSKIAANKTDPRAKVMRINKLTRQGFITAEFTTIDPLNTPLHVACLFHYPTDFILEHLLHHDKNAIWTENSSYELPIHYATMDTKGVEPEVFDALIRQYPDSIYHENIEGSLPIHLACQIGAPSLFVIEKLLDMCPKQVFAKSRLQVPVSSDERLFKEYQDGNVFQSCFADVFEFYDGNLEAVDDEEQFEYDWTPLHLAVLNGAPPLVLEAIINKDIKCLSASTNRGRTPMVCAQQLMVRSIMNQVPLEHVRNVFYAIEVLQSYEINKRAKDELKMKAGLVKEALSSSNSYGWHLAETLLTGENIKNSLGLNRYEETEEKKPDYDIMKGLTALHRAVMRREDPELIQVLIQQSPECIDLVSRSQKISPHDLAKEMLIKDIQNESLVSTNAYNVFVALMMMQRYKQQHPNEKEKAFSMFHSQYLKAKKRKTFGSTSEKCEYVKAVIEIDQGGKSLLGDYVMVDDDEALEPYEYCPPLNLNNVNFTLTVDVGFRRLRKAILSNKSEFLSTGVFSNALRYQNVRSMVWDRHGNNIGDARLNDRERCSDYIGARKVFSYIVPKSNNIDAHIVYDSMEIIEYNDYCFAVLSVLKEPDVLNGSEYETKIQTVFVDKGRNSCKMICSSQVDVIGMRQNVDDDWHIRKVCKYRASKFFHALADTILLHSGDGSRRRI